MTFADNILVESRPDSLRRNLRLPRRQNYTPSPADWRDEVLYFLLVDRFSDGREDERPLLDRQNLAAARPSSNGDSWRWDHWAESGAHRWQGGTLKGVEFKLVYLKSLGVTALWLSPVFKQRAHLDTYHGYGIHDFLEVDPRLGTRCDLVDLVAAAHAEGIRVILDIIFNHSGALDDHDYVFGAKLRFSSDAASDHQVAAAVALQLFTLGIPCIYYGTEQAFAGPESAGRHWLPGWGGGSFAGRYLREAVFGPNILASQGTTACRNGRPSLL